MKPFLRLAIAAAIVVLTNTTLRAVTPEDCNNGCAADQESARQACISGCSSQCQYEGGQVSLNYYVPNGCWPDPSQQYCIVDGTCVCQCYI